MTARIGGKPINFLIDTTRAHSVLTELPGPLTSRKWQSKEQQDKLPAFHDSLLGCRARISYWDSFFSGDAELSIPID